MTEKKIEYEGESYSQYRPFYSDEIYSLLESFHNNQNGSCELAIDVGTGTGQVATELSKRYKVVYGIDCLASQINNAVKKDNIVYQVGPAEDLSQFEDYSVDLITVGTAFHWFKQDAFLNEAKRVLKPNSGTLAILGYFYPLVQQEPAVNYFVKKFCNDIFGPYANSNIHLISNLYRDIQFPFKTQKWYITPASEDITHISLPTQGPLMESRLPLRNYFKFFLTASAYQNYLNDKTNMNKQDPIECLQQNVMRILKTDDLDRMVDVEWPTVLILAKNDE